MNVITPNMCVEGPEILKGRKNILWKPLFIKVGNKLCKKEHSFPGRGNLNPQVMGPVV